MRTLYVCVIRVAVVWLIVWFGLANSAISKELELTSAERLWLEEHPVIRLAPDPNAIPIEFFDDDGNYRGIAADHLKLIAQQLGIEFSIVHLANWKVATEKARSREVDMLGAATQTPLRSEYMLFTSAHTDLPGVIIVRQDTEGEISLEELQGKRVAVCAGYVWEELIRKDYPGITLELVSDVDTALKMVSFGLADAMVDNPATVTYLINREGIANLRMAGETGYYCHLAFASRSDWPILNSILEKALANISPQERVAAFKKWVRLETLRWVPSRRTVVVMLAGLIILAIVLVLIWNRFLKRTVAARTRELRIARDKLEALVGERTHALLETGDLLEGEQQGRKVAEDALLKSEHRYRVISEVVSDYCYSLRLNADGSYEREWLTDSFTRMTGYNSDDISAQGGWRTIMHPDDMDVIKTKMERISQGKAVESEYRIYRKDGEIRWLCDYAQPEWDESVGRVVRVYGAAQDITEKKNAEEERRKFDLQLQQTQKLESLGVLAGGIAHDFNNLLMGIIGNTDLALRDLPTESVVRDGLNEVMTAATRAAELSRQMLAYSGKAQFVVEPIDLNALVNDVSHLLKTFVSRTALLRINLLPNMPSIEADATQIRQVIMNLITNASEAIGEQSGVISLSSGIRECDRRYLDGNIVGEEVPEGDYVYIEVTDTGAGMDEETLKKIFDPFFTTKFTGRGLGLASVLGIVRGHKGCLLASSAPGQGTTFTVLFPALDIVVEARPDASAVDAEQIGCGTVLLVDDERSIRTLGKRMLTRLGFEVITASDGREAVEVFRSHLDEIVCVVMDLTMPHMNGEEAFRAMRDIHPDVCVFIASGFAEEDILTRFSGQGIAGSIHKPYVLDTLARKLSVVALQKNSAR